MQLEIEPITYNRDKYSIPKLQGWLTYTKTKKVKPSLTYISVWRVKDWTTVPTTINTFKVKSLDF